MSDRTNKKGVFMKISTTNQHLLDVDANIYIVKFYKNQDLSDCRLDKLLDGQLSNYLFAKEEFTGEFGQTYLLPTSGKLKADKVLLVGLGDKNDFNFDKLRQAIAKALQKCDTMKNNKKVAIRAFGDFDLIKESQIIAEDAIIGTYDFDKYKSKKNESPIEELIISTADRLEEVEEAVKKGEIIGNAMTFARNLINEPAQEIIPETLANKAKSIEGIDVTVYDENQIKEMGLNAYYAVGKGSINPPRLIYMKYKGQNPKKRIAIIGKGLTFDSGGMDLKPPASMLNMKDDMSGAACVMAVMKALAQLKPEIEVHAIVAACENMISGKAYKPGDVLTAKNGKTIEVDNTDAEGRITLADALCFADELNADAIIDIATLTGACMVALGSVASGIMGTNPTLTKEIIAAANENGEKFWELPLFEGYFDNLKSDIADMKNTGSRYGGASAAGVFLSKFVKNKNWAHLDIAGTAYLDKPQYDILKKGAAGTGIRTILGWLLK